MAAARLGWNITREPLRIKPVAVERFIISAIIIIMALFYVPTLGFYSDDWAFIETLSSSSDQSVAGLYAAMTESSNLAVRPLQVLWYVFWYKMDVLDPTLIHAANNLVFLVAVLTLHAAIRKLPRLRPFSFTIAILYICMPHFTTAKFWYANHQAPLAMVFAFLAFYQIARCFSEEGTWSPGRLIAVLIFTLASAAAYELFIFQLLLFPIFAHFAAGLSARQLLKDKRASVLSVVVIGAFILTVLFKLRYGYGASTGVFSSNFIADVLWLYARAAITSFAILGAGLPMVGAAIAFSPFMSIGVIAVSALILVLLGIGLRQRTQKVSPDQDTPVWLLLAGGAGAFVAGYLPFLTTFYFGASPFGISNRVNMAGALGVALIICAFYALLEKHLPKLKNFLFIAFCTLGVMVQLSIANSWSLAWNRQQEVYGQLRQALPTLVPGDQVLLFGLCPYLGPAPVFTSSWGLTDRLRLDYGLEQLRANTITPNTTVTNGGIVISEYSEPSTYAFRQLMMFDVRDGSVSAINSASDAAAFFAKHPVGGSTGCTYREGGGTPLISERLGL